MLTYSHQCFVMIKSRKCTVYTCRYTSIYGRYSKRPQTYRTLYLSSMPLIKQSNINDDRYVYYLCKWISSSGQTAVGIRIKKQNAFSYASGPRHLNGSTENFIGSICTIIFFLCRIVFYNIYPFFGGCVITRGHHRLNTTRIELPKPFKA